VDGPIIIQSIAYLFASGCYQDYINNEDCSCEESSWQDDREVDDRGEARSTIAFGPIGLEVAPSSDEGGKGDNKRDKGEDTSDGVEDKGDGQRL